MLEDLFGRSAKAPVVDKFDTVETVYGFVCPCDENYIGQCKRHLRTRIRDHFQLNKGTKVYFHCLKCPHYKKKMAKMKRDNSYQYLKPRERSTLIFDHFKSHFSIKKQGFRNFFHRIHTEAFFITTLCPSLNIQKQEKKFSLLSKMGDLISLATESP